MKRFYLYLFAISLLGICFAVAVHSKPKKANNKVDYFELGEAAWDNFQFELALEYYNKAIEVNPADIRPYEKLISFYITIDNYSEAIDYCTKAIKYHPENDMLYLQRDESYKMLEDFKNALNDYRQIIKLKPDYYLGYSTAAVVSYFLDEGDVAINYADKAIELNPDDEQSNYVKACVYFDRFDFELALGNANLTINTINKRVFEATDENDIKLPSFLYDVYELRGVTYRYLGQFENAIKDFTFLAELQSHEPNYFILLANTKFMYATVLLNDSSIDQQEYEEMLLSAINDVSAAIELDEENPSFFFSRALMKHSLNDNVGALVDINTAIRMNADDPLYYSLRSEIYEALGNNEASEKDFEYYQSLIDEDE